MKKTEIVPWVYKTVGSSKPTEVIKKMPIAPPGGQPLKYGVPNSLGGLYGAYLSEYERNPSDREIWDNAIRSYKQLRDLQAGSDLIEVGQILPDGTIQLHEGAVTSSEPVKLYFLKAVISQTGEMLD